MIGKDIVVLNCFSSNTELFIAAFLLLALFISLRKQIFTDTLSTIASLSICVGTSYNVFNRLVNQCVADYFNFFNFFKFNLADVFISVGVLVLALRLIIVENVKRKGGDS